MAFVLASAQLLSANGPKKINRANNANSFKRFQPSQMVISRDYQVSFPGHGTFQNPIVRFVIRNDLQGNLRNDDLGSFGEQLDSPYCACVIPVKFEPEHSSDFSHDGR
jgi:hypothetical protein